MRASGIRQSSPVRRNSWRVLGRAQTAGRLPPCAAARLAGARFLRGGQENVLSRRPPHRTPRSAAGGAAEILAGVAASRAREGRHLPGIYPVRSGLMTVGQRVGWRMNSAGADAACRGRTDTCAPALSPKGPRSRSCSPNVLPVMKRRAASQRGIRWTLGGIAAAGLAPAAARVLMVPAGGWLARPDLGSAREPRLETARDAARGPLLALGAGLLAAGALAVSARKVALSRGGRVTGRCATAVEQLGSEELDVRIGGIHALERVAREAPARISPAQTCPARSSAARTSAAPGLPAPTSPTPT